MGERGGRETGELKGRRRKNMDFGLWRKGKRKAA